MKPRHTGTQSCNLLAQANHYLLAHKMRNLLSKLLPTVNVKHKLDVKFEKVVQMVAVVALAVIVVSLIVKTFL